MAKQRNKVKFADEMPSASDIACPSCKKRFVSPVLLPCLHSMCKKCLNNEKLKLSNNVKLRICPVCSQKFDLRKDFPLNFVANNMVNLAAVGENTTLDFVCDSCETEGEKVTMRCNDCQLFLCAFCTTAHRRMTATKTHILQPVEQLKEHHLKNSTLCSVHLSERICYYCSTCCETLCGECTRTRHKGHEFRKLDEVAKTLKINMVNLVEQVKGKVNNLSGKVTIIEQEISTLKDQKRNIRASIEEYFKVITEALNNRMNELVNEVESLCTTKFELLFSRQKELEQTVRHANGCCLFAESAITQGSELEILSVGEIVIRRLTLLVEETERHLTSPLQSEVAISNAIEFVGEQEKIVNDISHLGHVKEQTSSTPCEPTLCILSTAKQHQHVITGEVNRMSLTAVSRQGKTQQRGGDKVKLSFSLAGSRVTPDNAGFKYGCQDNKNGTYTLAYVITKPDTYWLHVSVNGFPVADSPVTVTVRPKDWIGSHLILPSEDCGGFSHPYSVIVDAHDHVLIADSHNHRVKILSLNGEVLKTFGSQGTVEGQFNFPYCLALSRKGNLIVVTDGQNHRVQVVTPSGKLARSFGGFGDKVGKLNHPHGVAIDNSDRIYVADSGNSRIQIFSHEGIPVGMIVFKDMACPWGVAICKTGHIAVTDYNNHRVYVFNEDGSLFLQFGSRGDGNGLLNNPAGITVDDEGQFVVADRSNHRIQIFQQNGSFVTKFGGKGQGDGLMRFPAGVAVDRRGHLYVADTFNDRIQVFSLAAV
ncbi:E3 ubiquitin-protein ligase TRIM71-like isoform X1 [Montipora capricornis]|uniref:E3 ubiquitin-protein ligase TRIM71-like isoform X1 n=2 Tax=Montipora capricornis TaxID=246305 RepID=UPI0035F13D48